MPNETPDKAAETPSPVTTPPETPTPEKVEGQVEDKGKQDYQELQKVLGRQGQELGTLRQENDQLRGYVQQVLATQANQRPVQPEAAPAPTAFDYDNPLKSVDARIDARMGAEMDKKLANLYRNIRVTQAQSTMQLAKQAAIAQAPHLYQEGMDKEVEGFMQQAIRSGVDPAVAESPEMWNLMAYAMKGRKENFGSGGRVNAVSPVSSERPASAKARELDGDEPVQLEREHEDAIKGMGLDVTKFKQELAADRKKGKR